jgi:hypothetical protein
MKFEFYLGEYFAENFSLKLINKKLEYKASCNSILDDSKPCFFEPGKERWNDFISQLSKYECWNKEYHEDVYDGIQWQLKLEYGKIKSALQVQMPILKF